MTHAVAGLRDASHDEVFERVIEALKTREVSRGGQAVVPELTRLQRLLQGLQGLQQGQPCRFRGTTDV